MTDEERLQVWRLPKDVAREYFMERRYHGVGHDEAIRRAWESPRIISEREVK